MKIKLSNWFSGKCEFQWGMELIIIGRGYERRWIGWFAIPIASNSSEITTRHTPIFWTWAIGNQGLWTLLSLSTTNKGEIKSASVLTRLTSSLVPWCSLNWLNGWGRENVFGADCWDACTQKLDGCKVAEV